MRIQCRKHCQNIKSIEPDVTIALGDLSYEGTTLGNYCSNTADWFSMMKPIEKNLFMVVGNHDLDTPSLLKEYLAHFGLCPLSKVGPCGETYSFNLHKVHFLILNSESAFDKTTSQYLLADRDLRIASSDPDTKWIIVAYHSATYASIDNYLGHVTFHSTYPEKTTEFLNLYQPLFDEYGVDLVLQGHVHNYQRTYPIKMNEVNKPTLTYTAKTFYKDPDGEIYLTIGTAGIGHDDINPDNHWISEISGLSTPNDDYYLAKSDDKDYGFLELDFGKDDRSLVGTFYSNDPVKGSVAIDQFTISK